MQQYVESMLQSPRAESNAALQFQLNDSKFIGPDKVLRKKKASD